MRAAILAITLLAAGFYQEQMVAPKVEHKQREETYKYDDVTRTCPDGYEGHFVDVQTGFGIERYWAGIQYFAIGAGEFGYTICFKKEFMDKIKKNPELFAPRPLPPKPV